MAEDARNESAIDPVNDLRKLDACFDEAVDQASRVIVLIEEAIRLGIQKGSEIVSAIASMGYNRRYVGMLLSNGRGDNPDRYQWRRDGQRHYHLHT
jgi:hypothetical protein